MIRALVVAVVIVSGVMPSRIMPSGVMPPRIMPSGVMAPRVILRRDSGERIALSPRQFRLDVGPQSTFKTISAAVRAARTGDTVRIHAGVYAESTIVVDKPLTILGDGSPVLDGRGHHGLLVVTADDVTVDGLVLRNVGPSFVDDRAAIRVTISPPNRGSLIIIRQ